jgi:hypothetical protein
VKPDARTLINFAGGRTLQYRRAAAELPRGNIP